MQIRKNLYLFLILLGLILCPDGGAQNLNRESLRDYWRNTGRKYLSIPDIPGYKTLKGDFHLHTVFSDGEVWPSTKVMEAIKEGLDIIAITDHIEHRPHRDFLGDNLNQSYEIAAERAGNQIIVIRGAEITRATMPTGHLNALFVEDVNKLVHADPLVQIEEAVKQGGFILWNHPYHPDSTMWYDFHSLLLEKGWLHGIEVANGGSWYPVTLDWCKDYKLTAFANTDIHLPIDYWYDLSQPFSHRPMTLVFAREKTLEGVKEALKNKRTVGYIANMLLGPEDLIGELFNASVKLYPPHQSTQWRGHSYQLSVLENPTDLTFFLEPIEDVGYDTKQMPIEILPRSVMDFPYSVDGVRQVRFKLLNCFSGSSQHPMVEIEPVL